MIRVCRESCVLFLAAALIATSVHAETTTNPNACYLPLAYYVLTSPRPAGCSNITFQPGYYLYLPTVGMGACLLDFGVEGKCVLSKTAPTLTAEQRQCVQVDPHYSPTFTEGTCVALSGSYPTDPEREWEYFVPRDVPRLEPYNPSGPLFFFRADDRIVPYYRR